MTLQQKKSAPTQSKLNNFLKDINYNNVYLFPCSRRLAAQARKGDKRIQTLKGIDLMKKNVNREAKRLGLNSTYLINLATEKIWNLRSNYHQRRSFEKVTADANKINQNRRYRTRVDNNCMINRMTRLDNPQETTNNPIA